MALGVTVEIGVGRSSNFVGLRGCVRGGAAAVI